MSALNLCEAYQANMSLNSTEGEELLKYEIFCNNLPARSHRQSTAPAVSVTKGKVTWPTKYKQERGRQEEKVDRRWCEVRREKCNSSWDSSGGGRDGWRGLFLLPAGGGSGEVWGLRPRGGLCWLSTLGPSQVRQDSRQSSRAGSHWNISDLTESVCPSEWWTLRTRGTSL